MFNIYYAWLMFSPNMLGLNLWQSKIILNAFIKRVNESNGKENKMWVDQRK